MLPVQVNSDGDLVQVNHEIIADDLAHDNTQDENHQVILTTKSGENCSVCEIELTENVSLCNSCGIYVHHQCGVFFKVSKNLSVHCASEVDK